MEKKETESLAEQSIHLAYAYTKMFPSYTYLFKNNVDDYAMSLTLSLLISLDEYDENKATFGTFAYTVFNNYIRNMKVRSKRKKYCAEEISLSDILYDEIDTSPKIEIFSYEDLEYKKFVNQEVYTKVCNKLTPYLSHDFIAYYKEGKSYQQIANEKHVSKQSVGERVLNEKRFIDNYMKTGEINTNNKRYHKLAKALEEVKEILKTQNIFKEE